MASNSEIVLSANTHPGDSSDQELYSDKVKGDGFYSRVDGFHTVQYNITGLTASVIMQGTLVLDPQDADWFDIPTSEHVATLDDEDTRSGSFIFNFTGNYVWVRAYVYDWVDGTVNSILLNH